jgi:predicted ThiF/HesA family dinucleotide-utilizing enzyme
MGEVWWPIDLVGCCGQDGVMVALLLTQTHRGRVTILNVLSSYMEFRQF